jgi:thimet oligopeptidase
MRIDVYNVFKAYCDTKPQLEGEASRLLDRIMREYKRTGMHLPEAQRDEVKQLKERMSELPTTYAKNSNEENTKFELTAEEMKGLPSDFLDSHRKDGADALYEVSLKYPDYIPMMKYCKVPETRKKLEFGFNNRNNPENAQLLEELVELRHKQAQILGYETHAHFIQEFRMAKSPEKVKAFLEDLATKLDALWEKEILVLKKYKEEDCKENGVPYDGEIHAYDVPYLKNLVEEKDYQVDQNEVKKYFALGAVTDELLAIYQELLGLKFVEVKDPEVWHEEVRLFEVYNAGGGADLVGMFYMDMHPREGKYSHAACFGLQPGCTLPDGRRQIPVAAGVMNFSKPTETAPALLLHSEVTTFFHEFGHVMHQICSEAQFSRFSGTAVERDFVEAPSQMLENWCWTEEGLARLSSLHTDPSQKLPAELLQKLVASKNANAGYANKRQIVLGTFDQTIHTKPKADTAADLAAVNKRVLGLDLTPGTNMAASFGHLAGGYDAQYYGYLWSEVFSADMFESRFKSEGVFNQQVGLDYRKCILAPGGSQDASDMLRNFLGRDPMPEPFLRSIGLQS